jgi:hypothetical protein
MFLQIFCGQRSKLGTANHIEQKPKSIGKEFCQPYFLSSAWIVMSSTFDIQSRKIILSVLKKTKMLNFTAYEMCYDLRFPRTTKLRGTNFSGSVRDKALQRFLDPFEEVKLLLTF